MNKSKWNRLFMSFFLNIMILSCYRHITVPLKFSGQRDPMPSLPSLTVTCVPNRSSPFLTVISRTVGTVRIGEGRLKAVKDSEGR
jgi:hypothetical protein